MEKKLYNIALIKIEMLLCEENNLNNINNNYNMNKNNIINRLYSILLFILLNYLSLISLFGA
jgi:hypothetical protein